MQRLIALAILCLPLMGFSCEGPEGRKLYQTVFGETAERNAVLALGEFEAGEEVAAAFVQEPEVVEPPAPDCTPTLWRAVWTNPCTGETWTID